MSHPAPGRRRARVDVAERILHLAQAARGDGVHLARHLVAQQAGHARDPAEQGVDRAPASGDAQQCLAEPGGAKPGDRLGVEQPGLGEAGDQHLQFGHLVRRRRRSADAADRDEQQARRRLPAARGSARARRNRRPPGSACRRPCGGSPAAASWPQVDPSMAADSRPAPRRPWRAPVRCSAMPAHRPAARSRARPASRASRSRSRTRNMRTSTGRGTSPVVVEAWRHRGRRGSVLAAKRHGAASIRSSNACRSVSAIAASGTGGEPPSSAGRRRQSVGAAQDQRARLGIVPARRSARWAAHRSSPSSRRREVSGRKAANAGASARPLPGLLTMRT